MDRPGNFTQCFRWIASLLVGKVHFHVVEKAALCWAIWKLRNRAGFEKKTDKISGKNNLLCLFFFELLGRHIKGGG
jgi:hypothetical protein